LCQNKEEFMQNKIKRLGLFVFFDREGIVDDYVLYMLKELMPNIEHLTIISNSSLDKKNKGKLEAYTNDIIFRPNKGLDAGALADYFKTHQNYQEYDEIVYLNDTFYGPFYSFQTIFEEMSKRPVDFWGLSMGHPQEDGFHIYENGMPEHIQTFFMVFRKKVLESSCFQEYWQNYNPDNHLTFKSVVTEHEITFTSYLASHGFTYDSYIHDSCSENYHHNYNNFAYNVKDQIIVHKSPFIKRKSIVMERGQTMYLTDKNDIAEALEYIRENTDYDTSLIWQNILRLYNVSDLDITNLTRIITPKKRTDEKCHMIIFNDNIFLNDLIIEHLKEMTYTYSLYTSKSEIEKYFQEHQLMIKKIDSEKWPTILKEEINKITSPYVGYIYLKEAGEEVSLLTETVGQRYLNNLLMDNLITGALSLFEDNNCGILYAPTSYHSDYFLHNAIWVKEDYEIIKQLLPEYILLSNDKLPVSKETAWITKTDILKNSSPYLWDIKNNFHELLAIYLSYKCALEKNYPRIIMTSKEAENQVNILQNIYKETFKTLYKTGFPMPTFVTSIMLLKKMKQNYTIWDRGRNFLKRQKKKVLNHFKKSKL